MLGRPIKSYSVSSFSARRQPFVIRDDASSQLVASNEGSQEGEQIGLMLDDTVRPYDLYVEACMKWPEGSLEA